MKNTPNEKFAHPKLPFAWLASTFIAPCLVLVLPEIFKDEQISWSVRAAVALGLFSAMLFISCIILMLKFYELSYSLQILQLKFDFDEKHPPLADIEERQITLEQRQQNIFARLDALDTRRKEHIPPEA